jgi:hypothetical protein
MEIIDAPETVSGDSARTQPDSWDTPLRLRLELRAMDVFKSHPNRDGIGFGSVKQIHHEAMERDNSSQTQQTGKHL